MPAHEPERMCILTRQVMDERHLIRFVRAPDGTVTPDLQRKLPGRGVWVSLSRGKLEEVAKKNLFARGFEGPCVTPPGLADRLNLLLRKQALGTLSLARKAGMAVAGFMKVEEFLRKRDAAVLLHAKEAAADGCAKLNRLAPPGTVVFTQFSQSELDLAFGRSNVIHAAAAGSALAEKLTFHVQRLADYDDLKLERIEAKT